MKIRATKRIASRQNSNSPTSHCLPVAFSPHRPVPLSPRRPAALSPHLPAALSPRLRVSAALLLIFSLLTGSTSAFAQGRRSERKGSHSTALPESMSGEARELVERAINIICTERVKDPQG